MHITYVLTISNATYYSWFVFTLKIMYVAYRMTRGGLQYRLLMRGAHNEKHKSSSVMLLFS